MLQSLLCFNTKNRQRNGVVTLRWVQSLLLAAFVLVAFTGQALADDHTDHLHSVDPMLVEGNPTCITEGHDFGFKIDAWDTGDRNGIYTLVAGGVASLENGGGDPLHSVTIFDSNGTFFSWSSTLGMDAVIVKAQDANAFVYSPESLGDLGLHPPDEKEVSHVSFCFDYELISEKTAQASYTRTFTWTLDKSVDDTSLNGFIGDSFLSAYNVTATRSSDDSDFKVSGGITVSNPTPFVASFGVTDTVAGVNAVVECPTSTLQPHTDTVCTYSASLNSATDGTNNAEISSTTPEVGGATASAPYEFGDPTTVVGHATANLGDTNDAFGDDQSLSSDGIFSSPYLIPRSCSIDTGVYTDGSHSESFPNTATLTGTSTDATQASLVLNDSVTVTKDCYIPSLTKDATGSYTEAHSWTLTKSVAPLSASGFIGQAADFPFDYTVTATETVDNSGFQVTGTIRVTNHNPNADMTVDLSDVLSDGTAGTLDVCSSPLTVSLGSFADCAYTADPADADALVDTEGTNTATATLNGIDFSASDVYDFKNPDVTGDTKVTLADSLAPAGTLGLGEIEDSSEAKYTLNQSCSSTPADFPNGVDTDLFENTATLTGVPDESTEVTVTCYAPTVTKDATGSYTEAHSWELSKSVTPLSASGFIGQAADFPFDYTVTATETVDNSGFQVTGTIRVTNHNPNAERISDSSRVCGL